MLLNEQLFLVTGEATHDLIQKGDIVFGKCSSIDPNWHTSFIQSIGGLTKSKGGSDTPHMALVIDKNDTGFYAIVISKSVGLDMVKEKKPDLYLMCKDILVSVDEFNIKLLDNPLKGYFILKRVFFLKNAKGLKEVRIFSQPYILAKTYHCFSFTKFKRLFIPAERNSPSLRAVLAKLARMIEKADASRSALILENIRKGSKTEKEKKGAGAGQK